MERIGLETSIPRKTLREIRDVADQARRACVTVRNVYDLRCELRAVADKLDLILREAI